MKGMQIDIETGDLMVINKRAAVEDTDGFIAELVIRSFRGDLKECPMLGAEAPAMIAGAYDPFWAQNTKKMLQRCGLTINNLTLSNDGEVIIS